MTFKSTILRSPREQLIIRLLVVVGVFGAIAASQVAGSYAHPDESRLIYRTAPNTGILTFKVFAERNGSRLNQQAVVKLMNLANQNITWQPTSDNAQGVFTDIPYGDYTAEVSAVGYLSSRQELKVIAIRNILEFDVVLQRDPAANPNAPTGIALPRRAIEALAAEHPDQLVVVDEAYVDFGAESAVPLVARHDNLLVVQTLSKSRALAGLRVGFAIGQRPLIEALERVKDSFNSYPLGCLSIAGAVAAIKDDAWFQETRQRIMASRQSLAGALSELGFEVLPSMANFVFARHRSHSGADLAARLRERGVLVRHFRKTRIEDFLRITVGTEEQCSRLIELLRGLN